MPKKTKKKEKNYQYYFALEFVVNSTESDWDYDMVRDELQKMIDDDCTLSRNIKLGERIWPND